MSKSERRFPSPEYTNALNNLDKSITLFTRSYVGDKGGRLEEVLIKLGRIGTDVAKLSVEANKEDDPFFHGLMKTIENAGDVTGMMVSVSLGELAERTRRGKLFEDSPSWHEVLDK